MNNRFVNVFVFGAGASVHAGASLTKNFLDDGFNLLCQAEPSEVSFESFKKIANLLDVLYGCQLVNQIDTAIQNHYALIPDLKLPTVTIEELLTYVELGISNQQTWLPFEDLRQALHDFIFETLDNSTIWGSIDNSLPWNSDGSSNRRRNCYDILVDRIINVNDENCFISFNYDLLLDRALGINSHDLFGDYNLNFIGAENFPGYDRILKKQRLNKDVDLLKLHGSMNWGRCKKCNSIDLAFHRKYRSYYKTIPGKLRVCSKCKTKITPLLIPPTYRKQIAEYGIDHLWDKAGEFLSRADHIAIIGYSFPDPDIESKWLFKKSLAQNNKRPRLILVEPNTQTRNKLIGFFYKTVNQIEEFESFESFCKEKYKCA